MNTNTAIIKAQSGDLNAYSLVIHSHRRSIRAYIAMFIPSIYEITDAIAQNTFIFAFKNLSKYSSGTSLITWLKVIARNLVLYELKALKLRMRKGQ